MKKVFWIKPIIFAAILLLIACEKDKPSSDKEFKIPPWPAVKTMEVTILTDSTAILNGTVNANGLSTTVTFEYGLTESYGQTVLAVQSPVTGNSITDVSAGISGLGACPTYHFRVKAENSVWKNFCGSDKTFHYAHVPTLTTTSISGITATTAISGGNITDDGGLVITERGVICWKIGVRGRHITYNGSGVGSYTSNLNGLSPSTRYTVQSYAKNCAGIAYGRIIYFWTSQ